MLQAVGDISHGQSHFQCAEIGHLFGNLGKDLGPAVDVLLIPDIVGGLVRNAVGAHMDVEFGDASKVSVGDGLEEGSQTLSIVEVEDSDTVENRTSLGVDSLACEQKVVERSLPVNAFHGLRLLARDAIIRDSSGLHHLAANLFRSLLVLDSGGDDLDNLDGFGTIGLAVLCDGVDERASVLVRPSIVLLDSDELLLEEVAIDLVANLHGKTEDSWKQSHCLALVREASRRLCFGLWLRRIREDVVAWVAQEKARQLPCLGLLGRCVSARDDLLGFGLDLWLIIVQRFECAGISRAQIIRDNQLSVLLLAGKVFGHCALGLVWSVIGIVGGIIRNSGIHG